MRAILIVLVVCFVASVASAGPRTRISVTLQSGGCAPVYRPPCPPPVYRPAPLPSCGYGYEPQPQLIRCSACFQVRPVGTICQCRQIGYGAPGYFLGTPPIQGGYLPQGYSDPFSRAYQDAYESKARSLERQELQRQINAAAEAGRRDAERRYYYGR